MTWPAATTTCTRRCRSSRAFTCRVSGRTETVPARISGWALLALLCLPLPALAQPVPRIAIIIDDIGYHRERGLRAINLPAAITCAVIPRSPHGPRLAREAKRRGREIIIHMPMSASNGHTLDAGGIDTDMAPSMVSARIEEAFALVPQAEGMNNHMGSLATSHAATMDSVMTALA